MYETAEKIAGRNIENSDPIEAGVFLIDKPAGPTSFKIVQLVRRAFGIKKVGHSGTLDPLHHVCSLYVSVARPQK